MCVFIDFWKLETENNLLHVFSFLHKLSFEYSFCFLPVLSCQTNVLVSKIENYFWKQKTMKKNNYQTYPKCLIGTKKLLFLNNIYFHTKFAKRLLQIYDHDTTKPITWIVVLKWTRLSQIVIPRACSNAKWALFLNMYNESTKRVSYFA